MLRFSKADPQQNALFCRLTRSKTPEIVGFFWERGNIGHFAAGLDPLSSVEAPSAAKHSATRSAARWQLLR
ncbi:hypothetical protein, partial [uncultured Adlercreutzia sp.]|uniref:hypothetical protein n=1 Tax=uncultured Adlercreutzia sp. TaxID=875803 RepID=UPI0026F3FC72